MFEAVGVRDDAGGPRPASSNIQATLICFSHLRWDFVFQRPQHLMSRFAKDMSVIVWEEPMDIGRRETPFLKVTQAAGFPDVRIVVPHLPEGMSEEAREASLKRLLDAHVASIQGPLRPAE